MSGAVRRLPAAILLAVLALLPIEAWLRTRQPQVVVTNPVPGMADVTWIASVAPDGRLAVRITYDLDPGEHEVDVRVPPGARLLRVDGVPLAASIGLYATTTTSGPVTVTYELPGHVKRYRDGALLELAKVTDGSVDSDVALFPCATCYIGEPGYGNLPLLGVLAAPGIDDEHIALTAVRTLRADVDGAGSGEPGPDLVRFVGVIESVQAPAMLAVIPSAAVADLPIADGTVGDAYDRARDELDAAGASTREPSSSGSRPQRWVAIVLTAMFAGLLVWIGFSLRRAVGTRQPVDVEPGEVATSGSHSPPSDLEPALAGVLVGGAGRGDRSIAAASLLALAHRGVIRIEGIDSHRFTLILPPGARGSTPSEEVVLAALRPQGNALATATFTGPPLWGPERGAVARRVRRTALAAALRKRLVRITLSPLILLPVSIAMGVIALVASGGLSWIGWVAVIGGPILAIVASLLTGLSPTRSGRAERDRWLAYARFLREHTQLEEIGAPGVATWGEVLPHAAAIGAAPTAAHALSPGA